MFFRSLSHQASIHMHMVPVAWRIYKQDTVAEKKKPYLQKNAKQQKNKHRVLRANAYN